VKLHVRNARKQKKQKKNSSFAECSTRQSWAFFPAEPSFAECWHGTRQSDQTYAECQHSAKNFSKKNAECLTRQHSAKIFSKKKISFAECLTRRHSAKGGVKFTAPVTFAESWCGTRQILCRVPATWHSAKIPLPTTSLPSGLCRERHSAKPLPTAKVPLPSAAGTRQRRRIQ